MNSGLVLLGLKEQLVVVVVVVYWATALDRNGKYCSTVVQTIFIRFYVDASESSTVCGCYGVQLFYCRIMIFNQLNQ